MNSDELNLFALVASTGSLSRAALELGVDQSGMSRRMAALEAELGVRLFHRSGRGVVLTEPGRQLLRYAETVTRTLEEAQQVLRSHSTQGPAQLAIAAQPTIAHILFGPLGKALRQRYPHTQLRVVEGLASQILRQLSEGEIDAAILYLPEHRGALEFDLLMRERVRLVAPANYPPLGAQFAVRELGRVPLILPSTAHGLRVLVESLASRYGVGLNIVMECDGSVSLTRRLVAEGCGCSVLPLAAVAGDIAAGLLQSAPLVEPEVTREVALAMARNRPAHAGQWEMAQIIRQEIARLVGSGLWPDTEVVDGQHGVSTVAANS
jgi:LysR family transcriptional regulator, nitrogen assimilation regulatory protein